MKIDICINFNDLRPPPYSGMMPGEKPPYYNQLLYLIKSIKVNWDRSIYDYRIYVHHSRELESNKQLELRDLGCEVLSCPRETQEYFNRENVLAYPTDGDYTLILDTDTLVLSTPSLEFDKETYARPEGHTQMIIPESKWMDCYERLGMNFDVNEFYHFNGGVWFIKNSIKPMMHWYFIKYMNVRETLWEQDVHLSVQWYWSMLIKKFKWGTLNRKAHVFSREWPQNSDAEIVHYLGLHGMNNQVVEMFKSIEERYAAL